ncbi:unnamed protein product [Psylliodes chrysocephalus]|uniref:Protein FAM107B n=1 Tax=Psylliodes chrysocephalus TaxID=3402493 RepID=A0A9P0CKP4_9CUCU|nr:unnamed protein product [Psylliodes chrysocephala]
MDVRCLGEVGLEDIRKDDTKGNSFDHIRAKLENHDLANFRRLDKSTAMIPDTIGDSENSDHHQNRKSPLFDEDGLIIPKKLPNPVKENADRQNLHRELLFNQKIGKNILNQKTELQRALEKQRDSLAKKQIGEQVATETPELEKAIADRAKRLQSSHEKNEDDKVISKELLQIRKNLKPRTEANK